MIYRLFFDVVLRRIDAERAHVLASESLRLLVRLPGVAAVLRRVLCPNDPTLVVDALGRSFRSPLGVAAGLDKNATWFDALGLLGFGHVEVGTVTTAAQQGNPTPRVFRGRGGVLVNRMGFPNQGADAVAARLSHRSATLVVGANISKGRDVPLDQAAENCAQAARILAGVSDYLVVNVSSPNTPGLRDLQGVALLRPLIQAVQEELRRAERTLPLLVKLSPDLSDADVDAVADLAVELGLSGIVAVNTTTDFASTEYAALGPGGLSGPPLAERAEAVLRGLYARVGREVVLISAGGISTPEEAWARVKAGATLIQAQTGFVYGGPLWPARINRGLSRLARAEGFARVQDAIGVAASGAGPPAGSRDPAAVA